MKAVGPDWPVRLRLRGDQLGAPLERHGGRDYRRVHASTVWGCLEVIALKGDSYRLKDRDLGRVPRSRHHRRMNPTPARGQFSDAARGQIPAAVDTNQACVTEGVERLPSRSSMPCALSSSGLRGLPDSGATLDSAGHVGRIDATSRVRSSKSLLVWGPSWHTTICKTYERPNGEANECVGY